MSEGLGVVSNSSITPVHSDREETLNSLTQLRQWLPGDLSLDVLDKLVQISQFRQYRLGEQIFGVEGNHLRSSSEKSGSSPAAGSVDGAVRNLYVVCQGRVRLLCTPTGQSRSVTAQVVEAGETLGGDDCFIQWPLAYGAIATSEVQVLALPLQSLVPLLETCEPLRQLWGQAAQQRDRLIFFKTLTALRSHPSHQLQTWVADLETISVPAGTSLAQATAGKAGRFWLRWGDLEGGQTPVIEPGAHWDASPATPLAGVARTEVQLYYLPQAAANDPGALVASAPSNGHGLSVPRRSARRSVSRIEPPRRQPESRPEPETPEPESARSPTVAFPKPVQRQVLDWLNRYPWIEQQSSSDCGAACLAMIGRYWGKRFPIHALRARANVGRAGASLKSLAKAADSLGFHARPVRASLSRLADQRNPWIAHWEGVHFVVVYAVQGSRVIIADPALGRKTLSRKVFQERWTGYALLLEPTERLQDTEIKQASLGRYLGALVPYRALILQVILVSLLIQAFGLVSPLFTQIILDRVVVQKSMGLLNVFVVGLVLFGVWGICLSSVRQYLLSYFSNRLDLTLISGFINHTLTLPLKFFEDRRVGDIITRVQENQKIQRFLIGQVVLAWLNFVTGFVYLGLMLHYNWQLTLLVMVLIPPIVLLTLGATPFLRKLSRELFKESADQNSALVEMMSGIATVKSAAAERDVRWLWEDRLTRQMNVRFKGQRFGIGLGALNGVINSLGGTALLWLGASFVIQGKLTIGQFVAFNMMIGYVISPVLALANLWDEMQEVLISVERLNDVFETLPEESAQNPMLVLPPIQGEVEFEDVTFRYNEDEDRNTLQNLSFRVAAGQTVAIVGRSGSGKTTMVKLLEGLYGATKGRILVDGHDIRHVSPPSLRSQLGVVPQECFLFSGTIFENITLFRPEFSLEQVVEAAKLAEAHAFIQALPLGYNTKVGERGSTLSGGQRQRVAIARALLGHPSILLLDEATSSLDTESERRFQQNLAQISRDRTTFIIAHRLSTVRNADQILVLDRGILVERGTHRELMDLKGLYHHLAQQQLDL
jgi:ATP-binding cassette subfamily B protein